MDDNTEQSINLREGILQNSCKPSKNPGIYGKSDDSVKGYKSTILNCSQIVGYNNAVSVIRYELEIFNIEKTDVVSIFVSEALSEWQTMKVNLDTLNIPPGTELYLKAVPNVRHSEYVLERIIYTPNSNTVYFEYIDEGIGYYPEYRGMVKSPLSPPVLKCAYLYVLCDAGVNTRYELRFASNNAILYITNKKYDRDDIWLFALSDLNLFPGTKIKLHAGVVAGKDSEPYVILEYDPTLSESEDMAKFMLIGNAFYTSMLFEGLL